MAARTGLVVVLGALGFLVGASIASASTFSVTTTADAGPGSLRQAILDANAHAGADRVQFALPGSGVQTIAVTSGALPAVTQPLVIDGRTQPDFTNTPLVRVDNATGQQPTGFSLTAGPSEVRSLEITRFGVGVRLAADANVVAGCLIGTDAAGNTGLGNQTGVRVSTGNGNRIGGTGTLAPNVIFRNAKAGLEIVGAATTATQVLGNRIAGNSVGVLIGAGSTANTIGGTTTATRNLVSGNVTDGIELTGKGTSGNVVAGNFIGTDVGGTSPSPNETGIHVVSGATGNTIGGTDPGARNVISGNRTGVLLNSGETAIVGNYVGPDVTGTAAVGNVFTGIWVQGSDGNTIGGTSAAARNVISGTHTGIYLFRNADNNTIAGNYVGTNASGTARIGNTFGIELRAGGGENRSVLSNAIGGTAAGAGNVISGNEDGIVLGSFDGSPVNANVVAGNHIGTDPSGNTAIGNLNGVALGAADHGVLVGNTIGGTTAAARNVISGNTTGVLLSGGGTPDEFSGNAVSGNYIGTNDDGSAALPNGNGVLLFTGLNNADNAIGGTAPGARNVISGNSQDAVLVRGDISVGPGANSISGNYIGTRSGGGHALGNGGAGVRLERGAQHLHVDGNLIAFNAGPGVVVDGTPGPSGVAASGDSILGNSMFTNGGLGIDLLNGGNNDQAAPTITSVTTNGGTTTIEGTLASTPSTTFRIELFFSPSCDPSGAGEGKTFLGAVDTTTNAGGDASFSTGVPAVPSGQAITATATSQATGDTSEFSLCHAAP